MATQALRGRFLILMPLRSKHLLSIEDLSRQEVERILGVARQFREAFDNPVKGEAVLRGRTIMNAFFEPSTRTSSSFEIAAKRLGADAINFSTSRSSVVKGESLKDTALTLLAMNPDILVVRHPDAGAPLYLARYCAKTAVINAGDGAHEHPTQALLDAMTILDHKSSFQGLAVAIIGDIAHSRVARSNILLLNKLGAHIRVCAPPTLMPPGLESSGVTLTYHLSEALEGADVIMMLRTQWERQHESLFPSTKEYFSLYGLNSCRMQLAKEDAIVMHPGPINRGVEIDPALADGSCSVILDQVRNGVAVRMALLCLLLGYPEEVES
jgi:aspartate carbamoyltransferase catalytic subunit